MDHKLLRAYGSALELRHINVGDTMVGVCHRLPGWEMVDRTFFRKLEKASWSQALALKGDFNHPGIY